MKCIIIDDEPGAIDVLKRYVEQLDNLELAGTFRNPLKAVEFLKETNVDLVFLDINMPKINGLQFLRSLFTKPMVIFTTAYSEYAVESYEVNAVDYLVKPIEFERFLKAVNKVSDLKRSQPKPTISKAQKNDEYLLLKSGPQIHKVKAGDILFIEKEENYVVFNLTDKKIFVRANMNDLFDLVPESAFVRVHKSFVVNLKHISTIEPHQVTINKIKIPLSNTYREEFLKTLKHG
jgi:two-component system LytT family response regulator